MYARTWARRVLHEFEITHPRAEQFLRLTWREFHHSSNDPNSNDMDYMRSRLELGLRLSQTVPFGENLWKTFKLAVKGWEETEDATFVHCYVNDFGIWTCRTYHHPELY